MFSFLSVKDIPDSFKYGLPDNILRLIPREVQKLFPLNEAFAIDIEKSFESIEDQQRVRLKTLNNFCDSEVYSQFMEHWTHTDEIAITLFFRYRAYECRVAKTGTNFSTMINNLNNVPRWSIGIVSV